VAVQELSRTSTRFLAWATLPLGGIVGGALGTSLGLRPTIWLTSAGLPLSALWLVLSPLAERATCPTTDRRRRSHRCGATRPAALACRVMTTTV
jgi:hypothetical protein